MYIYISPTYPNIIGWSQVARKTTCSGCRLLNVAWRMLLRAFCGQSREAVCKTQKSAVVGGSSASIGKPWKTHRKMGKT